MQLTNLCKQAKNASVSLSSLKEKKINLALNSLADAFIKEKDYLKKENLKDIENARKVGKNEAFIDRLTLSDKVIENMAEGLRQVALLKSPAYKTVYKHENKEQGIKIVKKAVPFGVIGIIYESRPNVTADAFALCFKTRNAVVLKGGSESILSNTAIVNVIKNCLKNLKIDENAISLISDTSRETTAKFIKMNDCVDLLIPRGSASLIKFTVENATVPIIETGAGNCHVYVDKYADLDLAAEIIFNAKTQRYSVCNALESIVIHKDVLATALNNIYNKLKEKDVEIRLDKPSYEILKGKENVKEATREDFFMEYGGPIVSVKTVSGLSEAIKHINKHSTHHSECIITNRKGNAKKFQLGVDSSTVYVNTSTRMTDGFVFGLGAEIGISTQKLHARGPMGLDALLTYKYYVSSDGAIRK